MIAVTISASSSLLKISLIKLLSILTASMGKRLNCPRLECPVPKSSMYKCSLSSCICSKVLSVISGSSIVALSVISTCNIDESMPVDWIASFISSIREGSLNWRGEILTAIGGGFRPSLFQLTHCKQAAWITNRPIGIIRPASSAIGINLSGPIITPVLVTQRTSASNPTTTFVRKSTLGWYISTSSFRSNACLKPFSICNCSCANIFIFSLKYSKPLCLLLAWYIAKSACLSKLFASFVSFG